MKPIFCIAPLLVVLVSSGWSLSGVAISDASPIAVGQTINLTWQGSETVTIHESYDDGQTYSGNIIPLNGRRTPENGYGTLKRKIRPQALGTIRFKIVDASNPANFKESPSYQVNPGFYSPTQTDHVASGSSFNIQWGFDASGVLLSYSADCGQTFNPITDGFVEVIPPSGSFAWQVPNDLSGIVILRAAHVEDEANYFMEMQVHVGEFRPLTAKLSFGNETKAALIGLEDEGGGLVVRTSSCNNNGVFGAWKQISISEGNLEAISVSATSLVTTPKWRIPDFVFEPGYKNMTSEELEGFITKHRHLPHLPSGAMIEQKGLTIDEAIVGLMKQVEELSLMVISQQKEIDTIQRK